MNGALTRVYFKPSDNELLAALSDYIQNNSAVPGQIVLADDTDWLYWFVPYKPSAHGRAACLLTRGFVISHTLFGEILNIFNNTANLTKAELRALFLFVGGATISESAKIDRVSPETKRMQIKRCCAKLNCRGQTQLVKRVVGQLTHLISFTTGEVFSTEVAERFVSTYLKEDAQLRVCRLSNGRLIRYLESGPVDGQPVVFYHGIPFPLMLAGITPLLQQFGIRLITPIRAGYLEPDIFSELSASAIDLSNTDDDITELVRILCNQPVPVIGSSFCAVHAIQLIDKYPNDFSHLIFLSPDFGICGPDDTRELDSFFKAILDVSKQPGLIAKMIWEFRQYNTHEDTLEKIMVGIYGDCETDKTALEASVAGHRVCRILSDAYRHSFIGVANDFRRIVEPWEQALARLEIPIFILRGPEDHSVSVPALQHLTSLNDRIQDHIFTEGGHFCTSTPESAIATWCAIKQAINSKP